eukprot:gb/GECG01012358.1/.p1 GENE.gb/GECG01012358.1/~~gb/GECG01012358.1/.p1  ORF type:complete len:300 (+),score=52.61 gb/GECG01012358.1/:1-900(+)
MMDKTHEYQGEMVEDEDEQLSGKQLRQEIEDLKEMCRPESVNSNGSEGFRDDFRPNTDTPVDDQDLWMEDITMIESIKQLADEYEEEQEKGMEKTELQPGRKPFEFVGSNQSPVYHADNEVKGDIDAHVASASPSSTTSAQSSFRHETSTSGASKISTIPAGNGGYVRDSDSDDGEICLISPSPSRIDRSVNAARDDVTGDENTDDRGEVSMDSRPNAAENGGPKSTRKVDFISLSQCSDGAETSPHVEDANTHNRESELWHRREPMKELKRNYRNSRTTPLKRMSRNRRIDDMFRGKN